jgi:uncharacterized RmlC-like cupin family protein/predicted enzyme related to lactoylglutathione lyase
MAEEPRPGRVLQMRLVVEAEDYEQAVAFYRDVLGAPEELVVDGDHGERVTILDVGRATLELSNPAQVAMIDDVEVGRRVSPRLRVAFEVPDVDAATRDLVDAGAALVAAPVLTPWSSRNARLEAPASLQITLFEEAAMAEQGQIVVVTPGERTAGPSTPGMERQQAFATDGMWSGLVRTEAGMVSGWHHHAEYETTIYVLTGTLRMEFGPGGSTTFEAGPGDFIYVPKGAVHRESNPSADPADIVVVRAGRGPSTVNVAGPPPEEAGQHQG